LAESPNKQIMKALVTGGAGFIGSHIAEELCRRGAKVVVLDNLSLGSLDNLAWKQNGDDLEFVRGEVSDAGLLKKIVAGCDWVFHHAALPSVPLSVSKPVESNRDNLDASLELLVAARDAGVKRFLFASSSAIYGESPVNPKQEELAPDPLSPYALQKYGAEKYGQQFFKLFGLPTVSFRYFNVFGPRQSFDSPYSGVIARFCTLALEGKQPTVFGDGLQSRDFVYIKNVVSANLLAAEAAAERVAGRVYNIGCGQSVNLLQLLEELGRLTKRDLSPLFGPERAGDVKHSQADITSAQRDLGYKVMVSWQEGLNQTLDFYRKK
jgi:nucleoside-diphosphate-sugar epimerase